MFLREMLMRHAIYIVWFGGPKVVSFTPRMWGCIIQRAPPACYGTLVPFLSTPVGRTIQAEAQAAADFEEIELTRHKQGAGQVQGKERRSTISVQVQGKACGLI